MVEERPYFCLGPSRPEWSCLMLVLCDAVCVQQENTKTSAASRGQGLLSSLTGWLQRFATVPSRQEMAHKL